MRYRPHDRLIAPARARPQLWRLALGVAVAFAVYLGLIYTAFGLVATATDAGVAASVFEGVFGTTLTSRDTLLLLFSFACMGVGTVVAAHLMHGRGPISLTGPPVQAARDFARALRALTVLYALLWLMAPLGAEVVPNLSLGRWLLLLPLSLPALLIQTGAEELLFRGYLQQQLAARFRSPVIWMGLPSALFALGHYAPDEAGPNALALTLWAGVFGLAAADLTARTGNLGAAVALHFANNAASILFIALAGPVSGLALYLFPFAADDPALMPLMAIDLATILVSWLACRVALRV